LEVINSDSGYFIFFAFDVLEIPVLKEDKKSIVILCDIHYQILEVPNDAGVGTLGFGAQNQFVLCFVSFK
jgi:hypothetical protein